LLGCLSCLIVTHVLATADCIIAHENHHQEKAMIGANLNPLTAFILRVKKLL